MPTRHPSIRQSWHYLRRQAAVPRSVQFARGLKPRSYYIRLRVHMRVHMSPPQNSQLLTATSWYRNSKQQTMYDASITQPNLKCHWLRRDCVMHEQSQLSLTLRASLFEMWLGFPPGQMVISLNWGLSVTHATTYIQAMPVAGRGGL
jgi:hypothetical protein